MNQTNGANFDEFSEPPYQLGLRAEELASDYLVEQGYIIWEHRYRTTSGEVDLVAQQDKMLVFVEVKARRSDSFGDPIESIDVEKLNRLSRVADQYMHRYNWDGDWRIDVIGVHFSPKGALRSIEHLRDVTL